MTTTDHAAENWTVVLNPGDLGADSPTKVEVDGIGVLLYRTSDQIYAIGSECTHAGGPLEEGQIVADDLCVVCPWHRSVFRLEDGSVVRGPATVPEPAYEVRSRDGRLEIRLRP